MRLSNGDYYGKVNSFGIEEAIAFITLGEVCGVAAWLFIRLLVVMEDGFPKLTRNPYLQSLIGMTLIGGTMVVLTRSVGHSYIDAWPTVSSRRSSTTSHVGKDRTYRQGRPRGEVRQRSLMQR